MKRPTLLTALLGVIYIPVWLTVPNLNNILQQPVVIDGQNMSLSDDLSILTDDERVRYYMGKWYNASLFFIDKWSSTKRSVLGKSTKWSIFDKASYDYNISQYYWNDFFAFLNLSNEQSFECAQDLSKQAIFVPNDVISKTKNIPIFVKVREAGNNYPIPLQLFTYERHWATASSMKLNQSLYDDPLWKDKRNVAIWRGADTGIDRLSKNKSERQSFVEQYYASTSTLIDVAFADYEVHNLTAPEVSYQDLLKNKFLVSIQGNDVATNLKWILYSNSCPFMPIPTRESWAMEGLLKPYIHFVPIAQNKTNGEWNLEKQIDYCLRNDDVCNKIAQNGKEFMIGNKFLDIEHELKLQQMILDKYCQQYHIIRR